MLVAVRLAQLATEPPELRRPRRSAARAGLARPDCPRADGWFSALPARVANRPPAQGCRRRARYCRHGPATKTVLPAARTSPVT